MNNKLVARLKSFFCSHVYHSLKVGELPHISSYCSICGKLRYGNSIYYDGSCYQHIMYGDDSIEFIKNIISYLESQHKGIAEIKKKFNVDMSITQFAENYETIDEYNRVIDILDSCK